MINVNLNRTIVFSLFVVPLFTACQGPPGPQGPQGSVGISGYEIVEVSDIYTIQPGHKLVITATCPNGKKVLGGGHEVSRVYVRRSIPVDGQEWQLRVENKSDNILGVPLKVRAICAFVE